MGVSRWYTRCVIATAVIQYARAADIAFMTELQLYSQLVCCRHPENREDLPQNSS